MKTTSRLTVSFAVAILVCLSIPSFVTAQQTVDNYEGIAKVKFLNFPDCIELKNETTRVVLGHHVGGRILAYERDGKNVLFVSPEESNWNTDKESKKPIVSAGRFDVGPEWFQTRGNTIWNGEWKVSVLGDRKARMISETDPDSGLKVQRDFTLDPKSSQLTITQTVENHSNETIKQCYWSRTFAKHGGVVVIPCDPFSSRMPNLHVMYKGRYLLDFEPKDPAIRRVDDFLLIDGPTLSAKTGFDSKRTWVAYQTRDDQLFVKKYRVFPGKSYGEVSGMNLSVWYPKKEQLAACEIEPIGPLVVLQPGEDSSFSVDWWLLDRKFPGLGIVDPVAVSKTVEERCGSSKNE
jgi:hypothetical protein